MHLRSITPAILRAPPLAASEPGDRGRPLVGVRLALLMILGFWLFYFLLNTFRMWVVDADDQLILLGRRSAVTLVGMGLSFILYLVLRPLDRAGMGLRVTTAFLASIPVSWAYGAFNYYAIYVYAPTASLKADMEHMQLKHITVTMQIADNAVSWYFFIVAWAVLYIAMSNAEQACIAERSASLYRTEAQAAQLRALRYQLNPHFLFNTLNALSSLVMRSSTDQAERMIMNLSAFLRTSLTADPAADVTLAEEIEAQRLYLEIEHVRFPDRLLVEFDVPPDLATARLPGFLLQPLVENAIKYGVSRTTRPVTVAIRAQAQAGMLHLVIEDDGECTAPAEPGHGVGLRNVCARLLARFDAAATCRFGPRAEGGFRVELGMPLLRDG